MATVPFDIGPGGAAHYTDYPAWYADLDDDTPYDAGDDAIGRMTEMEDVGAGGLTLAAGHTLGLSSVTLTAHPDYLHDGTEGSGVGFRATADTSASLFVVQPSSSSTPHYVEDLEFDGADFNCSASSAANGLIYLAAPSPYTGARVARCILHANHTNHYCTGLVQVRAIVVRNIIYDMTTTHTGGADAYGIYGSGSATGTARTRNNTIYWIQKSDGNGAVGILSLDNAAKTVQNNLAGGCDSVGGGTEEDFNPSTMSSGAMDYNASEDTTAGGTNGVISLTMADQFISITVGAEELCLKAGADVIGVGDDYGTTDDVHLDIIRFDVDTPALSWDIGACQYVAAGGGLSIPVAMAQYRQRWR